MAKKKLDLAFKGVTRARPNINLTDDKKRSLHARLKLPALVSLDEMMKMTFVIISHPKDGKGNLLPGEGMWLQVAYGNHMKSACVCARLLEPAPEQTTAEPVEQEEERLAA